MALAHGGMAAAVRDGPGVAVALPPVADAEGLAAEAGLWVEPQAATSATATITAPPAIRRPAPGTDDFIEPSSS